MKKIYIENEVMINAPVSKVWAAITDPKISPKYMFGCEIVCDWEVGGPLLWRGVEDEVIYVKGNLVDFDKNKTFAFTTFDPKATYPDIPENHTTVRYELSQEGKITKLKVSQGDFNAVAEGKKKYEATMADGGWSSILNKIKEIVEEA